MKDFFRRKKGRKEGRKEAVNFSTLPSDLFTYFEAKIC